MSSNKYEPLDDFFFDHDYLYPDGYDCRTDWEKDCEVNKVSAPDPADLCSVCGRSFELCDCFEGGK